MRNRSRRSMISLRIVFMVDPTIRILIVNSKPGIRKMTSKMFNLLGYKKVSEATTPEAAWDAMQGANPPIGLLVIDYAEQDQDDALRLVRQVREDKTVPSMPVIVTMEKSDPAAVGRCLGAGVSGFVSLPLTSKALKDALEKLPGDG